MDMLIDKQERHDARGLAAVVAHIVVNLGSADVYIYIYTRQGRARCSGSVALRGGRQALKGRQPEGDVAFVMHARVYISKHVMKALLGEFFSNSGLSG